MKHQSLDSASIISHASAIHEMKLIEGLVHPVSLGQIARESQLSMFVDSGEL